MLVEILTLHIGSAVAKGILKLWIDDDSVLRDASLSVTETLNKEIGGLLARRRAERQFDRIAEEVAKRLERLLHEEIRSLAENELRAAVLAAESVLDLSRLDPAILIGEDLDPVKLEALLRSKTPDADVRALLGEAATGVFNLVIRESCNYIVEVAITLPRFRTSALRELLSRETAIIDLVLQVLERLPAPEADDGSAEALFDVQYRREIARKLDRLELFGVSLSDMSKRYALSVAYITLTATSGPAGAGQDSSGAKASSVPGGILGASLTEDDGASRVDDVIAQHKRVLIRGEAGSGKTTLLQWLAVNAARRSFVGALEKWNVLTPFFIQLRRFAGRDLPAPEDFVPAAARSLAGMMPSGWTHDELASGRALVLVDGVDELPPAEREAAGEWLEELTLSFPEASFIVTSRPPAVDEGWLRTANFLDAELLPMTFPDIAAFVDHWHRAAAGSTSDDEEVAELAGFAEALKQVIRDVRPIRALATSPLLCAMLCALNRDRRTELPRDRLQLYRIALEMLLERRDVERKMPVSLPLPLKEKELLLQDLAFWLLLNSLTDCEKAEATARIDHRLQMMPHVVQDADAVTEFLLTRSGVLREPVEGRVDFLHRTFQEYLAAKEAVEQNNINLLVENAHLDQWAEVVVLASGHARASERDSLIRGLLTRGSSTRKLRHRLHLLALGCLETSPELSEDLRRRLNQVLRRLVPPTTMSDAKALASAGELAVPVLTELRRLPVGEAAACIRTLSLIGTEPALEGLTRFAHDNRVTVQRELVRAWPHFDPVEFAQRVLATAPLRGGSLQLTDPSLLPGVPHLKNLKKLHFSYRRKPRDLSALAGIPRLASLDISGSYQIDDLDPLRGHSTLESLDAGGCLSLTDIAALSRMRRLHTLDISNTLVSTLEPLRTVRSLRSLYVNECQRLTTFGPLESLSNLRFLVAAGCEQLVEIEALERLQLTLLDLRFSNISDLASLRSQTGLEELSLSGCSAIQDISALKNLVSLQHLRLADTDPVSGFSAFAKLERLVFLDLYGSHSVQELEFLRPMRRLTSLGLSFCESIESFEDLRDLPALRRLDLAGCSSLDNLTFASGLHQLRQLDLRGCHQLNDLRPLRTCEKLIDLRLSGSGITDLSPLASIKDLQFLDLRGFGQIDLSPVLHLPLLRVLVDSSDDVVLSPTRPRSRALRVQRSPASSWKNLVYPMSGPVDYPRRGYSGMTATRPEESRALKRERWVRTRRA